VTLLQQVVVVLNKPQDPINIGATVRVLKNMGLDQLRLVKPVPYDPWRIEGVAHGTRDVVSKIRHFESLDEALADCVAVAAFAGKRRAVKWPTLTPRELAPRLLDEAQNGPVAMLFGQEDHGLDADSLDRAKFLVHIPTTEHASLNLAQAVLVAAYELHIAAGDATRVLAPPRKDAPPATQAEWEQFYLVAARALTALNFFETRSEEQVIRTVRSLGARAEPDARELKMLASMCFEVLRTIERVRNEAGAGKSADHKPDFIPE
jgi:tRNA/rRNA methyltransferase/tRNA (cytidine32/uridine32-2'-O)-methyltransferase